MNGELNSHLMDMLAWMNIGWPEIVIVLVILLVLFGGKKLPELARGLARGLRTFREELKGVKEDVEHAIDTDEEEPAKTPPPSESDQDTSKEKDQ